MTIECYYKSCEHHEVNDRTPDCGPFCHKTECVARDEQLVAFEIEREQELSNRQK